MSVMSKDFIFKKSMQGSNQFCILPRMKKSMVLFHIKKSSRHVTLLLKRKLPTCGSQVGCIWITSGLFCGSVSQMGQQVRPTDFQPWIGSYVYALIILKDHFKSNSEKLNITHEQNNTFP